jgi:hypothetical protein
MPTTHRPNSHRSLPTVALVAAVWAAASWLPTDARSQDKPDTAAASTVRWVEDGESLSLFDGDQLTFRYIFRSGKKPIIYPLVGPQGQLLARDYPMKPAPEGGTTDHIHQRSMWFTHGEVNDVDFWAEGAGSGEIVHQALTSKSVKDGAASFSATANWKTPDGKALLAETKAITVRSTEAGREIDFAIELTALVDEVHFGDTKEGSFGIRVPDSLMVDRKLGGKIINEHNQVDKDTWGHRSRWVDYSGPVADKTAGITVLEHPASFGHPCRWHVRTYGLFAANPFGEFHFVGGDKTDGFRLKKGDSIRLKYRIILHDGYGDAEAIGKQWQAFANSGS